MFRGKKYKESAKQIDKTMLYDAADGMAPVSYTHLTLPTIRLV